MSKAFDDWYDSTEIEGQAIFQLVDRGIAEFIFNNVRAYQREVDAKIAEAKADEWQESESGKWPEMQENAETGCRSVEYAIKEQKIDD